MRTRTVIVHALLLLLGACGPESGTEETGGGGSSSSGSSGGPGQSSTRGTSGADTTAGESSSGGLGPAPEGCSCRVPAESGSCAEIASSECAGEPLCAPIVVECSRPNPDMYACEAEYTYDEEALTCALEALRDRAAGTLSIDSENEVCGLEGCGSYRAQIAILADERVVLSSCNANPIQAESASSSLRQLAAPEHFEGCLALPAPADRYDCLFEGIPSDMQICG